MRQILHVIDSLGIGGAEKLLTGVINGMGGYKHHLVILHGPETLRPDILVGYEFLNLQVRTKRDFFTAIRKLKGYIKKNRIDIVHSHLYEANTLARLATPKKVPVFNSIHAISSLASYKINKLSLYLEKLTYKKRHTIIAVSHAVLNDFNLWVGIKGDARVLYNFIDDKYFHTMPPIVKVKDTLRLVAVGNLRWQKNYEYLIEAFKRLPQSVHLDIYGEGDLKEKLQREIDQYQLKVRLMGVRDDLDKVLPDYDAFVMSSFYEGQPLSLLEAMAVGLPALLADIPVLREVGGTNALYFDINDPESLSSIITQILVDQKDLARMGECGSAAVRKFARRDVYIEDLQKIYAA